MIKAKVPYYQQERGSQVELQPNEVKVLLELLAGSMTNRALIDSLGMRQTSVSRYIAFLRERGFVSSDNDSDDRRIVYNSITAAGRKYLSDLS